MEKKMTDYIKAMMEGKVETVGIASPKRASLIIFVTRRLISSLKSDDERVSSQIGHGLEIADLIVVAYAGDICDEEKRYIKNRFLRGKLYLEMSLEENIGHLEEFFLAAEKNLDRMSRLLGS